MKKPTKAVLDKLKSIQEMFGNDELEDNEIASSSEQAKTIMTALNKKISNLVFEGEKQQTTFVYCLLQTKIAKVCSLCREYLVYVGLHKANQKRLLKYFLNEPKTIHCLECNNHDTQPHQCDWCWSMLCQSCCPNNWLQN